VIQLICTRVVSNSGALDQLQRLPLTWQKNREKYAFSSLKLGPLGGEVRGRDSCTTGTFQSPGQFEPSLGTWI